MKYTFTNYNFYKELYPNKTYSELTDRQAKEVFTKFSNSIDSRVKELQKIFSKDDGFIPDYSIESLDTLQSLFWDFVESFESLIETEYQGDISVKINERLVGVIAPPKKELISVLHDIHSYFIKLILHNYPNLELSVKLTKSKKLATKNMAILTGFKSSIDMEICPLFNFINVLKSFIYSRKPEKEFLLDMYAIFVENN